jgi:hypothetical protein
MEWFLYRAGQVEGPISQVELLTKINAGEINDDELMCKKGEEQWRTLKDYRLELFVEKNPEEPPVLRDWILLIEQSASESQSAEPGPFCQSGPFTTEEVRQLIQSGQAKYSDYIWKTGFSQWSRINEVDEIFGSESLPLETPQIQVSEDFSRADLEDVKVSESAKLEQTQAVLENVLKQVNTGKHLDFVEQFPLAVEPVSEPLPKTEPLFAKLETPAPALRTTKSWAEMVGSTFDAPEDSAPETSTTKKSFKIRWDEAAQGQLFPWVMLSVSLAVTGLFAVWYFTAEAPLKESASLESKPSLKKPIEEKRPAPTTRKIKPVAKEPAQATKVTPKPAERTAAAPKPKVEKRNSSIEIERVAKQFQKKAELLDRQYSQLKDRPLEWQRFYSNWKSELNQVDSDADFKNQQNTSLLKKLSFGKKRLVQRANMMDENIINERAVSSDFEDENVPQIFRNISSQASAQR